MKEKKKKELWGILVGMLLGNESITYTGNIKIPFKEQDRDYALYKKHILSGNFTFWCEEQVNNTSIFKFYKTKFSLNVYKIIYLPKKHLTEKILNHLNKQGLAIWYMDSGGLEFIKNKDKSIKNRRSYLDVSKWGPVEKQLIQEMLVNKFDLSTKLIKDRLYLNIENTLKLIEIIKPYIQESKNYKICLRYKDNNTNNNLCKKSCDLETCLFHIK